MGESLALAPSPELSATLDDLYQGMESGQLSYVPWRRGLDLASSVAGVARWLVVDLIAYGSDHLGEQAREELRQRGLGEQTIANYGSVGRAWPRRSRQQITSELGYEPPFSWFEAVSRRDLVDDAAAILADARDQGWGREELRLAVRYLRAARDSRGDPDLPYCDVRDELVTSVSDPPARVPLGDPGEIVNVQVVVSQEEAEVSCDPGLAETVRQAQYDTPPGVMMSAYLAYRIEEWVRKTEDGKAWAIEVLTNRGDRDGG